MSSIAASSPRPPRKPAGTLLMALGVFMVFATSLVAGGVGLAWAVLDLFGIHGWIERAIEAVIAAGGLIIAWSVTRNAWRVERALARGVEAWSPPAQGEG